jgi:hypothetical protein
MGGRRPWLVIAMVLACREVRASDHWFDFAAGVSVERGSALAGGRAVLTFAWPLFKDSDESKRSNIIIDVGADTGRHDSEKLTTPTYLAGYRRSWIASTSKDPRAVPFWYVLGGVSQRNASAQSLLDGDSGAVAAGLGIETVVRSGSIGSGVRAQVDLMWRTRGDELRLVPRLLIAGVIRIHERKH